MNYNVYHLQLPGWVGLGSLPAAWSYPFQGSTMQAVSGSL